MFSNSDSIRNSGQKFPNFAPKTNIYKPTEGNLTGADTEYTDELS